MKLIEVGGKLYDKIWKKIEYRREWAIPFQIGSIMPNIGYNKWNGGRNEVYKEFFIT